MMIGQNPYRYYYFFGRILSFTLAGMIAGEVGAVLQIVLKEYHVSAGLSFLFGGLIFIIGLYSLLGFSWQYPGSSWLTARLSNTGRTLSLLMLRHQAWPTFLFGFFTIALPCGQTVIVYSACALSGDPWIGLTNGFAFAMLTTPALLFAMQLHGFLKKIKVHYNTLMGVCALFIGALSLCRGLAELDLIPHLTINTESSSYLHIVLF